MATRGGLPNPGLLQAAPGPWCWPFTSMDQGEVRIILENVHMGLEMASLLGNHFSTLKHRGTQEVQILPIVINEWKALLKNFPQFQKHISSKKKKKSCKFLPKLLAGVSVLESKCRTRHSTLGFLGRWEEGR